MALAKSTCTDGANTIVAMVFSTAAYRSDKYQVDRFIKCIAEWLAADRPPEGGATCYVRK